MKEKECQPFVQEQSDFKIHRLRHKRLAKENNA